MHSWILVRFVMSSLSSRIKDLEARLRQVQTAIAEVEVNGSSFTLDGITYTRATQFRLYERESNLKLELARLKQTRPMVSTFKFGGGYS